MNQIELEGNQLIAEFMGYKTYLKRYPKNHGIGGNVIESPKECIVEKLKYHSSWDSLIPACKKYAKMPPKLKWEDKMIFYGFAVSIDKLILNYEITPVFEKLAEGIMWYNKKTGK